MAAPTVKITYLDGTVKTVRASARAQMATEERYGGIANEGTALRATFYLGWISLNLAGQEPMGWEEWVDKIDDVEIISKTDEKLDPTAGAAPSRAASSS